MSNWIHKATGSEVKTLGGFPIIYADPPWQYQDRNCNGAAEQQYRTMPLTDIKALPVGDLAAKDAVLFMWATFPLIDQALETGRAWGFEFVSIGWVWLKLNRKNGHPFYGLGRWTRGNTEPCFIFKRGKPKPVSKSVSQLVLEPEILEAPIQGHSTKPACVRDRIFELMGDQAALEMFARDRDPRFEVWGNETDSTIELTDAAH